MLGAYSLDTISQRLRIMGFSVWKLICKACSNDFDSVMNLFFFFLIFLVNFNLDFCIFHVSLTVNYLKKIIKKKRSAKLHVIFLVYYYSCHYCCCCYYFGLDLDGRPLPYAGGIQNFVINSFFGKYFCLLVVGLLVLQLKLVAM